MPDKTPSVRLSAVVLGLAAVGGALLIKLWPPGAAVVAGAALAVLALRHWNQVVRHSEPLRSFGRTALPLFLPLLVVAIAGAIAFDWWLQLLIVFGVGLFAWRVVVAPEWSGALKALATPLSRPRGAPFWTLGIPILVAVVIFFVLIRPGNGPFEDRGGLVLLYATIPFWFAAVLLRALGYSSSALRIAIGACLVLLVACLAAKAGVVPGGDWLDENLGWVNPLTVLAAMLVLLAVATIGPWGLGSADPDWTERLRPYAALGLVAAIFASVILGAAAIDGAISARAHSKQRVDADRPAGKPQPADEVVSAAGLNNRLLAVRYAPELVLAKDEQWRPIPVESFVADAKLYNRAGRQVPHPNPLPNHCPGPDNAGCFKLVLPSPCDTGDDPCAQGYAPDPANPKGTAYFRVLRQQTKHGGYAFAGNDRYTDRAARETSILIQYWFFYRYNEWKRPILSGTLAQRHQGDWEAVTLGLSDAATPVFLAYSEHCGGTWRNWNQIETGPSAPLHPLVAVARGSHANYVSTDERRSPDWASCGGGLPKGFLNLISYASNIRDETSLGTEIPYGALHLILASVGEPPMSFPGTWGANDRTTIENERTQVLKSGSAPATPTYQPLWQDPLVTIFCGAHWEPPSGDSGRRCKTPAATG